MLSPAPLTISSESLLTFMSPEQKTRSILLVDLKTQALAESSTRFDLTLIFRSVAVSRGIINLSDYYVGTTGASITLTAFNGDVVEYSGPSKLAVDYEVTLSKDSSSSSKFSPELKLNVLSTALEARPGSTEAASKHGAASQMKFSAEEMPLVPLNLGDAVEWQIDSHRGDKLIRDFLLGTVELYAVFRWSSATKSGQLRAKPTDVRFYDDQRRLLSPRASLLMWFALWKKGIKIENPAGVEVPFASQPDQKSGEHWFEVKASLGEYAS
jgi:hypothetical protein